MTAAEAVRAAFGKPGTVLVQVGPGEEFAVVHRPAGPARTQSLDQDELLSLLQAGFLMDPLDALSRCPDEVAAWILEALARKQRQPTRLAVAPEYRRANHVRD